MEQSNPPALVRLSEGLGGAEVQAFMREFPGLQAEAEHYLRGMSKHRGEWPGKQKLSLCATVPWHRQPSGRRARKAAFAHNARLVRHYLAATKAVMVACGKYSVSPPNAGAKRAPA
ncbi:MAG: hypothetical protein IOD11_00020 [Rhodocyclaceae bacterium]|nr:hypothetical protein [Rhodocyclaceae bacterium]MCA3325288.1 hypothetical protein [Roseomonas sp.]